MITIENVGACLIYVGENKMLPGDSIEIESICDGVKRLIAEGRLSVSGDNKKTAEIAKEVISKKKRKEPKTISEAETGNEYK